MSDKNVCESWNAGIYCERDSGHTGMHYHSELKKGEGPQRWGNGSPPLPDAKATGGYRANGLDVVDEKVCLVVSCRYPQEARWLAEKLNNAVTAAFLAGKAEQKKLDDVALAAERERAVEECCKAVCNSCGRGLPVFFKAVYSEKKFWIHDDPYNHDCGAARIHEATRLNRQRGGRRQGR